MSVLESEHVAPGTLEMLARNNPFYKWLKTAKLVVPANKKDTLPESRKITHTSFDSPFSRLPPVYLPYAELETFYRKYAEAYRAGFPLYTVEKIDKDRPAVLLFDYDIAFTVKRTDPSGPSGHLYDTFLQDVFNDTVKWVLDAFGPTQTKVAILDSDIEPRTKDGQSFFRHGIHFYFTGIFTYERTLRLVRRHLVDLLQRHYPPSVLADKYNLHFVDGYEQIVDLSVCKNGQIRMPGARKLVAAKAPCECKNSGIDCRHGHAMTSRKRYQTVSDPVTKRTARKEVFEPTQTYWYESRRFYRLKCLFYADQEIRSATESDIATLNDPDKLEKLCSLVSVLRDPDCPDLDVETPCLLDDAKVPDTTDDTAFQRNPYRGQARGPVSGPGGPEGPDGPVRRPRRPRSALFESPAVACPPVAVVNANDGSVVWKDLFLQYIHHYFPRDAVFVNADKYLEHVDRATKKLRSATCIAHQGTCENKDHAPVHNNPAVVFTYNAFLHNLSKKCCCKHDTIGGRKFKSCASYAATVRLQALPPYKKLLLQEDI